MKVLHLLKSTAYSGAENVALSIMQHFPEEDMTYASPNGPIRKVIEDPGQKFYPLEAASVSGVRKAIQEVRPDIIHAHDFSMSTYAAWATSNIPVIAHLHNNPPWIKKLHPKTLSFLLSVHRIKKIITVSPAIEKDFMFSDVFSSKITVIGNVVNSADVIKKASEEIKCSPIDILFLGRLSAPKNPVLFCEIVEKVKKEIPEVQVVMIGEGELRSEVEQYIFEHHLNENIKLLGFQSNPYPYLNKSKLLLMPSAWEGFGLVAVEALCLGKPVVCSGAGGLIDIVDNDCGAICKSSDDYANAVIRLLSQPSVYKQKSACAIERVASFSNWEAYKARLNNIYSQAIEH